MEQPQRINSGTKQGVCIIHGCGGRVVKKIVGERQGELIIDIPKCEKCGQFHVFAHEAPEVFV